MVLSITMRYYEVLSVFPDVRQFALTLPVDVYKRQDEDLLEDVIIENKQAIEMANIYSGILSGMMDAFASVKMCIRDRLIWLP